MPHAQRLAASELTFFDHNVSEFSSQHAAGKSAMFLVAFKQIRKRKG
jgi:hypothetical protein